MTTRAPLVSADASSDVAGPAQIGGKAWNLLRLREHGFPVPRFWVVSREHFDRAVASRREAIERALGPGGPHDPREAARRIADAMSTCAVPADVASELAAVLPAGRTFAVRSSAVGEDSSAHSFAGVLESVLDVKAERVASAIPRVWASAFSARALAYRRRKGLALDDAATAVIVQEMAPAASAGVLVTRDPADGERRIVVAAGLGLGQGVVEGSAETDTHRMGWDDGACSSDVRVGALRPPQLRRLHALGREVERALGGPQDVEWAFDARGRLFVLQARPIVGGPRPAGTRRVWDNANIVESYPGLTLPLTFSFARRAYKRAFSRVARSFLAPRGRPDLYDGLIGLVDGRVYYDLQAWYEMFAFLPGAERYRASWDRLVGVGGHGAGPAVRVSPWVRARALAASLAILARAGSLRSRFRTHFDALRERFARAGDEATVDEVLDAFRALEENAASFWHLTLQNDFRALKLHQWAGALLDRWSPGHAPALVGSLLEGTEPVESVLPVRSLFALVDAFRSDPAARDLLRREDDAAAWAALGREPRFQTLHASLRRHLEEFGDRGVAELKLETVTFAEDPPRLVGLIRRYLSLGVEARPSSPAPEAVPGVQGWRRLALRFVLTRTRAALCAREEMRLARTRLFGIVRRMFRRLGVLLAEQGQLDTPGDVHYLAVGELLDFGRGRGVTREIRSLVSLRRAEYARFETTGIPRLDARPAPPPAAAAHGSLTGSACAAGIASGRATVVLEPERAEPGRDRILITPSTDPGWVFLMMSCAGIVVERGSPLSHSAIIGRELGIPTVVGAAGATRLIPEGAPTHIDGGTGEVRWA
ncbi:MAG TPA: PEP/pyruvate-binding domain-containing protein [Vicinamibacteria bacterium]|nr:PEP/pyruvate-binding domain-containing protein [Vicinamibacteria bacterium]